MAQEYVTKEFCGEHHRATDAKIDAMCTKLDRIHARLFVDNGSPSMQTRLDRADRMLAVILWMGGVLVTAIVSVGVKVFFGE